MRPSEMGVEKWGEVVELGERTGPVVFHFRPTKYLRVEPDRLKDWEELFVKNIGLRPDKELVGWSGDPKETISGSNSDWDDCDYW